MDEFDQGALQLGEGSELGDSKVVVGLSLFVEKCGGAVHSLQITTKALSKEQDIERSSRYRLRYRYRLRFPKSKKRSENANANGNGNEAIAFFYLDAKSDLMIVRC